MISGQVRPFRLAQVKDTWPSSPPRRLASARRPPASGPARRQRPHHTSRQAYQSVSKPQAKAVGAGTAKNARTSTAHREVGFTCHLVGGWDVHADARRLVAAPERLSLPHSYALQHCVRARSAGHWEAQEIGRSTQVSLTRTTASTNVASLTSRSGLMFPETLASATGVMIGTSCSSAILLSRHRRRDRAVGR